MTARYPVVLNGATFQELQIGDTLAGQAASGANGDITSLTGLTTALSVAQGGTGATTAVAALTALGAQSAISFGTGVSAWISTPTSANLLAAVTDETGTGSLVFNTTPAFVGLRETKVAMSANDINLATGNYFTKTISGATTLTVSNVPSAGLTATFILDLTNGASATITWWGVKWVGGTAPTLTAAGRDSLGFFTHDGGTTWSGVVIGKDIK